MLNTLKIENVALIDKVVLSFDGGLNVISGETGAGKSIILDALSFVFGGRADRSLIRSGCERMRVEAIFNNLSDKLIEFVNNELGISVDDEMFLSRELDLNGKNICKINGELVPISSVKKICQRLVDLHGQSEHLAILDNNYQLEIIDLFGNGSKLLLDELHEKIEILKSIENEIKLLGGSESEKQNLIDLYSYQIKEIVDAKLSSDEFDRLTAEKKEMQQYEKINESLRLCYEANCKNSFSSTAVDNIYSSIKAMQSISHINEHYSNILDRLNSLLIELEDINETVLNDLTNNVFDQEKFDSIDGRLDFLKNLYRKYGGNYESTMKYYNEISQKLTSLINSAERFQQLNTEREKVLDEIDEIQAKLTQIRTDSAKSLVKKLQLELRTLGMPNARVDVEFSRIADRYSYTGADRVEFMFSANLGFELKPLNKVVSGGEMSRVVLAYKIVVSVVDDIQTIIFDEIDSGLSGNIASVVAEYMARLSLKKQIIAISHLPQICAMADNNIKVMKYSDESTTHTQATILRDEPLYEEIARLMGATTKNGLNISQELKEKSNDYKHRLEANN